MKSFYLTTTVCSLVLVVAWASSGHTFQDFAGPEIKEGHSSFSEEYGSARDVNDKSGPFSSIKGRSMNYRNGSNGFFSNGLIGISEFVMSKVENSLDDLPSLPRLEPQECMKRSICEANHQPKKYGLMGLAIQLLFPPYTETTNPNRVVSKYQLAARYGRQESANCAGQYDGCMFNFLDLVQSVIQTVFRFG